MQYEDIRVWTQLWIAAFWTALILTTMFNAAINTWLLHKEIRAWLRGDRDINAPQPAEMRHGDAIKMFQLKRVEDEKSARPRMGYLTAILCVFLAAFLAGGYMLLVNTNLLR